MDIKSFFEWMSLKEILHFSDEDIPHVNQGEVWWASLGENVGFEINGKSKLFTRPVLIFRKFSNGFYFGIPLTTQKKIGSWFFTYRHRGREITACLHQGRSVDYRRLYSRIGRIDDEDYRKIQEAFEKLYLTDDSIKIFPAISDGVARKSRK